MPVKTLYHGSHKTAGKNVIKTHLKQSTSGNQGPGIYATDDVHIAKQIAMSKASLMDGNAMAAYVLEMKVELGKCCDFGRRNDRSGSWRLRFDSCTALHPAGYPRRDTPIFREYCIKEENLKNIKITGAYVIPPPAWPYPIQSHAAYYIVCQGKYLDNWGKMLYQSGPDKDGMLNVGPCYINIQWILIRFGDVYNIINDAKRKHLDGNVRNGEKVKLWVGPGGIHDQGACPQFIQWRLIPAQGVNSYFIQNVGKKMYLDSNGMGLWRGRDLQDKGSAPHQITWKLVPA